MERVSPAERTILWGYWGNEVDRVELQFVLADNSEPDNIVFAEADLQLKSFRAWWGETRVLYSPLFVVYFDELIARNNR